MSGNPPAYASGKSDDPIVPKKAPNKAPQGVAEGWEGRESIFDFLGFTHICGKNWKTGHFTVKRKTKGKRLAAKLKSMAAQLRKRMHEPIAELGECSGKWRKATSTTMPYPAIFGDWQRFAGRWRAISGIRCGGAANGHAGRIADSSNSWTAMRLGPSPLSTGAVWR